MSEDEEYSRRRLLRTLTGTGAVGAAGGAATGAYLSDWEPIGESLFRTGSFGLEIAAVPRDGTRDPPAISTDDFRNVTTVPIEFPEMEPGDTGVLRTGTRLCESPGWVRLRAESTNESGLASWLDVTLMRRPSCDGGGRELFVGTLAGLLDRYDEARVIGDGCHGCEPSCLDLEWKLDEEVPAAYAGMSLSCRFEFTAVQCRHIQNPEEP
ncbi:hypothetical protein SAMN04488066_101146 [Halorubrum aquaticum]|uniref:SipW-cognate class signal peptide n=1 Tax=Halorubrum aquaticum TaxID=387340 RepID=A0A1I2Z2K7_9EURY|nr:hypothetical protein [Halorubrum aquaticum]SFH31865.1 hypothetical protein SAMN04488066_101146 [Halorubrum aquaticum]